MFYNKQSKTTVISVASTVTRAWENSVKEWLEKLFPDNFECQIKTFSQMNCNLVHLFCSPSSVNACCNIMNGQVADRAQTVALLLQVPTAKKMVAAYN